MSAFKLLYLSIWASMGFSWTDISGIIDPVWPLHLVWFYFYYMHKCSRISRHSSCSTFISSISPISWFIILFLLTSFCSCHLHLGPIWSKKLKLSYPLQSQWTHFFNHLPRSSLTKLTNYMIPLYCLIALIDFKWLYKRKKLMPPHSPKQTLRRSNKTKVDRDVSIARSVPEISVLVVRSRSLKEGKTNERNRQ